jgi:hypothetical protein
MWSSFVEWSSHSVRVFFATSVVPLRLCVKYSLTKNVSRKGANRVEKRKEGLSPTKLCVGAKHCLLFLIFSCGLAMTTPAQVNITIDHNTGKAATSEFRFKHVPSPSRDDAATKAKLMMVDADADPNSADISALTDGILPTTDDQPRKNFFLRAGSGGGRVRLDLGSVIELAQINTYSWHPSARGPQVYRLWASDGADPKFNDAPKANINPALCGWKLIAIVDTRSNDEDRDGGQFGVSITSQSGRLGKFRYMMFDFYVTEIADDFGNTFYSEIDVVASHTPR